jgi:hypothetical protein
MQSNHSQADLPFFFLTGRARSGTTLIRTVLDAHPQVCIPVESPYILKLYRIFGASPRFSPSLIQAFYRELINIKDFDKWPLDFDDLEKDLRTFLPGSTLADAVRYINLHYISLFPKEKIRVIGDKNPPYSLHLKTMLKIMPEAPLIYVVRDPRDQVLSMKKHNLYSGNIVFLAKRWVDSVEEFLQLKKQTGKKICLLRYEDFVANPHDKLRDICDFLNIDFHPAALEYHQYIDENRTDKLKKQWQEQHHKIFEKMDDTAVFRWKQNADAEELTIIDHVCSRYYNSFGYEIRGSRYSLIMQVFVRIQVLFYRVFLLYRTVKQSLYFFIKRTLYAFRT